MIILLNIFFQNSFSCKGLWTCFYSSSITIWQVTTKRLNVSSIWAFHALQQINAQRNCHKLVHGDNVNYLFHSSFICQYRSLYQKFEDYWLGCRSEVNVMSHFLLFCAFCSFSDISLWYTFNYGNWFSKFFNNLVHSITFRVDLSFYLCLDHTQSRTMVAWEVGPVDWASH